MSNRNSSAFSNPVLVAIAAGLAFIAWNFCGHNAAATRLQAQVTEGHQVGKGEIVYVPIYSSIFYENGKSTMELAATLYIHNVNPDRPITLIRADYYDTTGKLIKKYLDKPLSLAPLQAKSIVIERSNTAGGTGANFLVEWQSQQEVTSPLIEAVMVNASSNLGIAFTTTGKVVRHGLPGTK
jgi:hypothetical protein